MCLIKSFVMRFNECAIHRILRMCGNFPEIKLRAEWTFDPASITIPANFWMPISSRINCICWARNTAVWLSPEKSLIFQRISRPLPRWMTKFQRDLPDGLVQLSKTILKKKNFLFLKILFSNFFHKFFINSYIMLNSIFRLEICLKEVIIIFIEFI